MSELGTNSLLSRLQPQADSMWDRLSNASTANVSDVDFAQFIGLSNPSSETQAAEEAAPSATLTETQKGSPELRKAFDDFVGQTLYGSMLAEMRKGLEGPAYFGGGRAEKVFQGQLDQHLVERISEASAASISEPMFDLFMTSRS